jgi:hypothetical protein
VTTSTYGQGGSGSIAELCCSGSFSGVLTPDTAGTGGFVLVEY